jgi:hypothetical protein
MEEKSVYNDESTAEATQINNKIFKDMEPEIERWRKLDKNIIFNAKEILQSVKATIDNTQGNLINRKHLIQKHGCYLIPDGYSEYKKGKPWVDLTQEEQSILKYREVESGQSAQKGGHIAISYNKYVGLPDKEVAIGVCPGDEVICNGAFGNSKATHHAIYIGHKLIPEGGENDSSDSLGQVIEVEGNLGSTIEQKLYSIALMGPDFKACPGFIQMIRNMDGFTSDFNDEDKWNNMIDKLNREDKGLIEEIEIKKNKFLDNSKLGNIIDSSYGPRRPTRVNSHDSENDIGGIINRIENSIKALEYKQWAYNIKDSSCETFAKYITTGEFKSEQGEFMDKTLRYSNIGLSLIQELQKVNTTTENNLYTLAMAYAKEQVSEELKILVGSVIKKHASKINEMIITNTFTNDQAVHEGNFKENALRVIDGENIQDILNITSSASENTEINEVIDPLSSSINEGEGEPPPPPHQDESPSVRALVPHQDANGCYGGRISTKSKNKLSKRKNYRNSKITNNKKNSKKYKRTNRRNSRNSKKKKNRRNNNRNYKR